MDKLEITRPAVKPVVWHDGGVFQNCLVTNRNGEYLLLCLLAIIKDGTVPVYSTPINVGSPN